MVKIDRLIKKIKEGKLLSMKMNRWRTYRALDKAEKEAGAELAAILVGDQKIGDRK